MLCWWMDYGILMLSYAYIWALRRYPNPDLEGERASLEWVAL